MITLVQRYLAEGDAGLDLMAGLHTGGWVDMKPTEQGGGVESL
ncbi:MULTISPECIES: hypothetical protein [unclassified Mycolicibacterium]|nr:MULTISPECIES: hypothetical protein [unclassified Mycolicibacterium]